MNAVSINDLKQTLIVPIVLFGILILFSFGLGWNLLTLFLFWFLLTPFLAYSLPTIMIKETSHLKQSIIGLIIFYAIMVFMIYEHYQTDYFLIMMISLISNILIVYAVARIRRHLH